MKKYEYIVIDSNGDEHSLVSCYVTINEGHVCFHGSNNGLLHAFFQPISSLCLGEYKEVSDENI